MERREQRKREMIAKNETNVYGKRKKYSL